MGANGEHSKPAKVGDTAAAELKARLSRKRTKTGCLTCRKRRIKCSEERPVCRNCVKSKRHCEGYNQRVIFKPPTFDYRPAPHGGAHITFQAQPIPGPGAPYHPAYPPSSTAYGLPLPLMPRPVEQFVDPPVPQPHASAHPPFANHLPFHPEPAQSNGAETHVPWRTTATSQDPYSQVPPSTHHAVGTASQSTSPVFPDAHTAFPPSTNVQVSPHHPLMESLENGTFHSFTNGRSHAQYPVLQNGQMPQNMHWASVPPLLASTLTSPVTAFSGAEYVNGHGYVQTHHAPSDFDFSNDIFRPPDPDDGLHRFPQSSIPLPVSQTTPEFWEHEAHIPTTDSANHWLTEAAVEVHDDDYYDVESDEEMDIDTNALAAVDNGRQRTLSRILHGNHISIHGLQTRRYDTFLSDGVMDVYHPEEHANPLRNPATARVFAHFISVTGPSLSIFERHPRNTSVLFTPGHIPPSQRGIWTYTLPLAALHHQGLLHAMLALGSLHIARLTGASTTPSFQHYSWALKRVHACVGHPKKRLKLTTIAASMLLGFYEILTADHIKWNTHLAGTKQLFLEIDFPTMTRQLVQMQAASRARRDAVENGALETASAIAQEDALDRIPIINERTISEMVGREVRYGDHGHVIPAYNAIPQELDLGKLEILMDLYWWYCKQDAYQSLISGNALLLDYSRWADCPPRAPMNKLDRVYGTFDHLVLLLGRIADFIVRDRERKLKVMEQNGGQWRPAPGMNLPRPPQQPPPPQPMTPVSATSNPPNFGANPTLPQGAPPPPSFYGMAPPPRQGFHEYDVYGKSGDNPSAQSYTAEDLQAATQAALEEHSRIRAALTSFENQLGEPFQPLPPHGQSPLHTSFGPAITYRSFDIGCLWAIYYMAVIIAIRSHPHMPPAAHMAAGVAAAETAPYAQKIGQIVAGIVPTPPDQPLNPSMGAALSESCMPSFFAAVQYQDPHQRHETVMRIFSIAQRTGWGSPELIANGCETAWVKAAAAGRGPPYTRLLRKVQSDDPRLNGSWEMLDPAATPDEEDDRDRRLVRTNAKARLAWAIGIMGMEEDVR